MKPGGTAALPRACRLLSKHGAPTAGVFPPGILAPTGLASTSALHPHPQLFCIQTQRKREETTHRQRSFKKEKKEKDTISTT